MRRPADLHLLAGAVGLSAAGDMLALLTLALAVFDLTGSGPAVAAFFAATMLPTVALAPVAGLVADRVESTRVLAVASLAQAAVAVALAFAVDGLPAILALTVLLAAGSAVSAPAEFALVPVVAGRPGLTRANGVMEAARYAGFALGPLAAAALMAVGDARLALLANAASFVGIAVAAALLRARRPPAARDRSDGAPPDRARDGAAALLADPVVRPTIVAAVAALAVISAVHTLEVFYVKEVLEAGDAVYALLTMAWMAAMIAGATVLAPRVPARVLAPAALVALAVQGAGMAAQTTWAIVPAAFAGYLVGGLGHGVKNTLLRTLVQRRVPAGLHGRAFAAYSAARNAAE
ncbi:MAG TPA: MFS transporter, partial [Capillimicrobium sp.]